MTTRVLKLSLIVSAILLFSVTAKAESIPSGSEWQLKTGQVGAQVVGKTQDGQFFAVSCKEHIGVSLKRPPLYTYYTANMAFPNSMGDVVYKIREERSEAELSDSLPLTQSAADKICVRTEGVYQIRVVESGGKPAVDVVEANAAELTSRPYVDLLPVGTTLQVQTALVGQKVVAASPQGGYFAIMCDSGLVLSSTADFIYPNPWGKIIVKDYNSRMWGQPPIEKRATYLPMTRKAMAQICNHPKGTYTVRVDGTSTDKVVELVGEKDFQADTRAGGRGY